MRSELVQQLLSRVVARSAHSMEHVLQTLARFAFHRYFLYLRGSVLSSSVELPDECLLRIKDTLEYLPLLSPTTARGFIKVIHLVPSIITL